jgi:hypothetical protein
MREFLFKTAVSLLEGIEQPRSQVEGKRQRVIFFNASPQYGDTGALGSTK